MKLPDKICKVEGCGKPLCARGMCQTHYQKWWRNQPDSKEKMRKEHREWIEKHPKANYRINKRWRKHNPKKRNEQKQRNYVRGAIWNINSGKSYDDFEIQMIIDKVIINRYGKVIKEKVIDRELARHLGRTVRAIQEQRHCFKQEINKT